jgi:L-threonylcarbamoyladenylate synthase
VEVVRVDGVSPDAAVVAQALAVLRSGGLIVYPTDTLYALGGLSLTASVAERVLRAKGRPEGKPLPVIATDLEQVRALCAGSPPGLAALAARFWPGPLTLVLAAATTVPSAVTAGTGTVAVRIPALPLARRLCAAGPLISTSANLSGGRPPVSCAEAVASVGALADLALDGGAGRPLPSTIVDLAGVPRLLRAGPVAWEDVEDALRAGGGNG